MGMDLIGPLVETPHGKKYIITFTDDFSKWAEAVALTNKTAVEVAKFFYSVVSSLTIDISELYFYIIIGNL